MAQKYFLVILLSVLYPFLCLLLTYKDIKVIELPRIDIPSLSSDLEGVIDLDQHFIPIDLQIDTVELTIRHFFLWYA